MAVIDNFLFSRLALAEKKLDMVTLIRSKIRGQHKDSIFTRYVCYNLHVHIRSRLYRHAILKTLPKSMHYGRVGLSRLLSINMQDYGMTNTHLF